jgi:hypothetical protein
MTLGKLACVGVAAGLLLGTPPMLRPAPAATAARACAEMADRILPASAIALPTRGARITAARIVPASAGGGPAGPAPEYCRIEGSILSVDPAAPPINFAVAIPAAWNGMSWQMGGGGVNGSIPGLTGPGGPATPGSPSLLSQGYAVFGSDSGHQGQATEWVRNAEAWKNFAYEQLKKTHDAAQAVLLETQGRKSQRQYFAGSSQGGREGLEVIARYGKDYDGVLSSVPLAYFQGLLIDPTIKVKAQTAPDAWIAPEKYPAINAAVQKACDGLDGLEDGIISHVAACNAKLDISVTPGGLRELLCPGGGDTGATCLSAPQLAMLNSLHAPVKYPYRLPNGFSDWPGWAPGADTGLLARTRPDPSQPNGPFGIGQGVQRQLFGGGADFDLYKLDLTTHRPRLEQASRELDVPPGWQTFLRKGGKLIWVNAAADTISNPRSQIRLYEELVRRNGKAAIEGAVRFYILPMGNHGAVSISASGQAMPSSWNAVGALRDWVEHGVAPPDAPVLSTFAGETITATRPICRYPAYPHYVGGAPRWATAFQCRK